MAWVLERLKEPSTIRGLFVLAGVLGWQVAPDQQQAILAAVLSLIAAYEVFRKEA
jgi:hypothetical protein